MSRFRLAKLADITTTMGKIRGRLHKAAARQPGRIKPRSLRIDPLEERQMLTVSPTNPVDVLVNQQLANNGQYDAQANLSYVVNSDQSTVAGQFPD